MTHFSKTILASALLIAFGHTAHAVEVPHTFEAGQTARAAEVNANFAALVTAVQALSARVDELQQQLAEAEGLLALKDYVSLEPDQYVLNGYTVLFSGVNVQIVNGEESTATFNGLGNLIVGYNEPRRDIYRAVCSNESYHDETACVANSHTWAVSHKTGSHNVVGGAGSAYSSYGGLVVGEHNAITGRFATVTAGRGNVAVGQLSSVSGGHWNMAAGGLSSVSAGVENKAYALGSSITGGESNETSGWSYSSISGGLHNLASGGHSSISGGQYNEAHGSSSSISGGWYNAVGATHTNASILGGSGQNTTSHSQTIPAIQ